VNTGELLTRMRDVGADVVKSTGARSTPREAGRADHALQGNLDPAICLAPWPVVADAVRDVLTRNAGRPGHVFNLGHGVLPETDPAILEQVVALVHEEGRADAPTPSGAAPTGPDPDQEGTT
jgi:uroporphyrinogen decarboxylase